MKQWLMKQIVASGYDVSAAIDRALGDMGDLTEVEHRMVDRAGLTKLIGAEIKKAKLTIPKNGGPSEQMPLRVGAGRWSYLRLSLPQLKALYQRELRSRNRQAARTARLYHDLGLYKKHADLPTLQSVWDAEHVEYAVDEAA